MWAWVVPTLRKLSSGFPLPDPGHGLDPVPSAFLPPSPTSLPIPSGPFPPVRERDRREGVRRQSPSSPVSPGLDPSCSSFFCRGVSERTLRSGEVGWKDQGTKILTGNKFHSCLPQRSLGRHTSDLPTGSGMGRSPSGKKDPVGSWQIPVFTNTE